MNYRCFEFLLLLSRVNVGQHVFWRSSLEVFKSCRSGSQSLIEFRFNTSVKTGTVFSKNNNIIGVGSINFPWDSFFIYFWKLYWFSWNMFTTVSGLFDCLYLEYGFMLSRIWLSCFLNFETHPESLYSLIWQVYCRCVIGQL